MYILQYTSLTPGYKFKWYFTALVATKALGFDEWRRPEGITW